MSSLRQHRHSEAVRYEISVPPAYAWNRSTREDAPRYQRGEDGYWYDPTAVESDTVLISCVGDLMAEPRMTNACRYGDAYFFHPLFRHVREILRSSDFAIANLETTLSERTPYAGEYHCIAGKYHCNAPACYLDAVRYAGFDALITANNHNCDSGVEGLWDTLRAVDDHGFMRTGSFLPSETERVLLVKVGGIRLAILGYGNRYNGLDERHFTKEGIDTCLNWFSRDVCLRDVAYARENGAEFVLCYQHWGCDYDEQPNEQQYRILEELKGCGVDYIVGSHTHCLQEHTTAKAEDGREIPMIFSMGNFVTNERRELCRHTGILQLVLSKKDGHIIVEEQLIPCYVFDEFGTGHFCVVPTDGRLNGGYTHERMEAVNAYIRGRVGESLAFAPTREVKLSTLCEAMWLPCPEGRENRPVTKLCTQSGTLCRGAVYFAFGEQTLADRRRLVAAEVAAIVSREPIADLPCLLTDDVTAAYRAAHAVVRPMGDAARAVLVAGAKGKTVARETIARVLRTLGGVLTPQDAEHMDLCLWQDTHPYHRYIVSELRDGYPLSATEAVALYRPDVLVLTAAPCEAEALINGLPDGSAVVYNAADAALVRAVEKSDREAILRIPYGDVTADCPSLPFAYLSRYTAAALAVGNYEGVEDAAMRSAISSYAAPGFAQAIVPTDGVTLVLNTACHTEAEACSVLRAAPEEGRRIAVLAAPSHGEYTKSFAPALAAWNPTQVLTLYDVGVENAVICEDVAALEIALTEAVRDGDVIVINGGRAAQLCEVVRRVFGVTDGFIPGAS